MAEVTQERINQALSAPPSKESKIMHEYLHKLNKIEAKERCLRVQFLDWLSDKLLNWSNRVHEASVRIDAPCVIEVAPRKREESQHAKESKEIARLKELLATERKKNTSYNVASALGDIKR
jgi:hypothetical protein